jgi:hypothetical protein
MVLVADMVSFSGLGLRPSPEGLPWEKNRLAHPGQPGHLFETGGFRPRLAVGLDCFGFPAIPGLGRPHGSLRKHCFRAGKILGLLP